MSRLAASGPAGDGDGLSIEALFYELSARFLHLPSEQVDREIKEALEKICESLGLDRSTVWLLPVREPDTLVLTHSHQGTDAPPTPSGVEATQLFPWALQQLKRGETIVLSKLDDLPPEAARDRESWNRYGTKSSLVIPLEVGGAAFGAVSFATVRQERDWPEGLVKRLELFAQVLANATARARNDQVLKENAERLRLVTEAAGVGMWVLALDARHLWATPLTRDLFGFGPDEEVDIETFFGRVHPEDLEMVRGAVAQAAEVGTEFWIEYRAVLPGGKVRWISSRGGAERGSSGKPERIMGISLDVTERKSIEETLRRRNQYIETVLEQAPIGFAVHTIDDGVGRFVSARFEEIYGVPKGTITSHTDFFEKVWRHDPAFGEEIRRRVAADLASGDPGRMHWENVPVRLASGETRYITAKNIPLFEQNLMVSAVQDVTDRVRAERALEKSLVRFRQVAENVGDFIWEVDANGLYTYTSASVERILGYRPEELVGKVHYYDLFTPDSREELMAAATRAFAARESFRAFPNANVAKDGSMVYLETSGSPILGENGNLLGYRGADTDVTARKKAEEQVRQSLEEVKRLRDQLQQENVYLRGEMEGLYRQGRLVGQSRALKHVLGQAAQVASTDSTVLLLGETGTGKELIASAIHESSPRRHRTMVRVNCAAIPASLLESELFGREKGAYTGALSKQIGRFELADQSTLFLDEIGEIPPEVQAKLLRVLQDKQLERLGGSKTFDVDVRIITATNRDLAKAVREGRFREDLYYRLNVFPITLPPLRDRREDIPVLVSAFVEEFAGRFGRNIESIARESMAALQRYHWPGNVRELRNVIERAMIISTGPKLWIEAPDGVGAAGSTPLLAMRDAESQHIRQVLDMTGWRIRGRDGAAEVLKLRPTTLESRMKKLGIRRPDKSPTK